MRKIWTPERVRPPSPLVGSPIDDDAIKAVHKMLTEGCGDNDCNWISPTESGRFFGTDSRCRCLGGVGHDQQRARLREVTLHLISRDARLLRFVRDEPQPSCGMYYHAADCDCDGAGGNR